MSTATITAPSPAVGQVWKDRDPRMGYRTIEIVRMGLDRAYYVNARGEERSISIYRLRPWGNTKGYEFVR